MDTFKFNNIIINKVIVGDIQTNCYIIKNPDFKSATIIDPGAEAKKIIENLSDYKIDKIILSHGHFDHISAIDDIAQKYDFELLIHKNDFEMLGDSNKNGYRSILGGDLTINKKAKTFEDGDIIQSSGIEFCAMHTPGHTLGSACIQLVINDKYILFTGDTIFKGGYGRTDFYGGDFKQLVNSIRKLIKMPNKHLCFTGHGEETEIGKG